MCRISANVFFAVGVSQRGGAIAAAHADWSAPLAVGVAG